MDALPRGSAQIVTASRGPSLPLLHDDGGEYPVYTGPLGVARLYVRRDRYLIETCQHGFKWWAFLANDPDGKDVAEYAVSYESAETALREVLGVYLSHDHDSESLAVALRDCITSELNQLGATV